MIFRVPAALDLVRGSSFVAPDRSLTVLRASIPKDYLDEIIWRNISDYPDAYVKDRVPAVHGSFRDRRGMGLPLGAKSRLGRGGRAGRCGRAVCRLPAPKGLGV